MSLPVAAGAPSAAQDQPGTRATLRGLGGVRIVCAELAPELVSRGITTDVVMAEVNLQLRQARIPILAGSAKPHAGAKPQAAAKLQAGDPELYVEVLANIHPTFEQCSFGIRLEVRQAALLDRDRKLPPARVVTWSTGGIGEAGTDWRAVLREELAFYVQSFVAAYLEANPTAPN